MCQKSAATLRKQGVQIFSAPLGNYSIFLLKKATPQELLSRTIQNSNKNQSFRRNQKIATRSCQFERRPASSAFSDPRDWMNIPETRSKIPPPCCRKVCCRRVLGLSLASTSCERAGETYHDLEAMDFCAEHRSNVFRRCWWMFCRT